jgi:D-alanine--poly(phosphoribitol) ligase subunit 1
MNVNNFYLKLLETIKSSDAIVYRYYNEKYTYRELYSQMLMINSVLYPFRNRQVVTYTSKGVSAYAAIFSVFLSNNVWVPISSDNPDKRNMDILKQVAPSLVLHDGTLPDNLLEYFTNKNVEIFSFDELFLKGEKKEFDAEGFNKDDTAYIMFTSGSTGTPKGVPMTHENYINFIHNAMEILPFNKKEVFSDYHDFCFDISIFYLFCCILTESAFAPVLKPEEKIIPLDNIIENRVTVWSSVPSVIFRLMTFNRGKIVETPLRIMFLCGEPFRLDVLEYCLNKMGVKNVYNFYGLTETGVENFYHKCHQNDLEEYQDIGFVPIGKPLKGNQIHITKENELLISGCQVTPGYIGGISPDKFEIIGGIRWFHTGDIVIEHKGVYFCKGRMDSQVKLSGYRVELMDIEAHIRRLEGIEEAVCFIKKAEERETLVAAIKVKDKIELNTIQMQLRKHLPNYMIPKEIFCLDNIPLNKNGKIDRKRVQEMCQNQAIR